MAAAGCRRFRDWALGGVAPAVLALAVSTLVACRDKTDPAATATARAATAATASAERAEPAASVSAGRQPVPSVSEQPDTGLSSNAPPAPPSGWPTLTPPDIERDFCTERVHTLDADACFVLPAERTSTLLIYLHGIVPPTRESVPKTNLENVVANAAERAGVVALLPRGKRGFSPKSAPGWWGWPTSKAAYTRHAAEFIEKIRQARLRLERVLAQKFERQYLAGSSSGAYFVAAVALHGDMREFDGFGVLSGGSGYPTQGLESLPPKAVYIGFGVHDSVAAGARALGLQLERLGWPVRIAPHAVGHGAREVYLDEAFEFWRR